MPKPTAARRIASLTMSRRVVHDDGPLLATRLAPEDDGSVQLVQQADAAEALRLIERGEQLAALDDALAGVTQRSRGRLTLVRGEAGIGKTALVTHSAQVLELLYESSGPRAILC